MPNQRERQSLRPNATGEHFGVARQHFAARNAEREISTETMPRSRRRNALIVLAGDDKNRVDPADHRMSERASALSVIENQHAVDAGAAASRERAGTMDDGVS